jgi:hypothetical protein
MAKSKDRDDKRGKNVLLAAASPSLPRDEKTEAKHSRTAKERLAKAKSDKR